MHQALTTDVCILQWESFCNIHGLPPTNAWYQLPLSTAYLIWWCFYKSSRVWALPLPAIWMQAFPFLRHGSCFCHIHLFVSWGKVAPSLTKDNTDGSVNHNRSLVRKGNFNLPSLHDHSEWATPNDKRDMHDEISVLTVINNQYRWLIYTPIIQVEYTCDKIFSGDQPHQFNANIFWVLILNWCGWSPEILLHSVATKYPSYIRIYLPVILPWM